MAGNAFHTAVECMVKTQQKDTFGLGQQAVNYFNETITDPANPTKWAKAISGGQGEFGYWVDDYGWWGIAFRGAYNNADFLGYDSSLKDDLATNAKNCWEALRACWNDTEITWMDPNRKQHTITGGIPNTWHDSPILAGGNCVTNECYWILSSFLGSTFSKHYFDPNANANDFFAGGAQQGILFDSNGLVLERFFGMRSPNQSVIWPNTEHPNWTWLGDQGLFLACCWLNAQFGPGNFGSDQALAILKAVQANNIYVTANGVLHEDLAPYDQFQLDYACGKGTFMRSDC